MRLIHETCMHNTSKGIGIRRRTNAVLWTVSMEMSRTKMWDKSRSSGVRLELVKTIEISGMGGHYEETCQKLLWTGIKYLSKVDNAKDLFRGSHGINLQALQDTSLFGEIPVKKGETIKFHGILETPESLKEMEEAMSKAVKGDWTGMQHQTVIGHLEKIAEHGYEWWLDQFKDEPKRIKEIDIDKLLECD